MRSFKTCFPFYIFFIALTFFVKDNAFFWDTIQLASKQAHWYFDNNFQFFFLPEEIDSGHPPFFGMSLAFIWNLFGKSLWISHFTMLPFLLGIVYFLHRLGEYYFGDGKSIYLLLLVIVDPFLLGQSILVSPDIVLVFAWLMALWAILSSQRIIFLIATFLLAAISMRGMMVVFSLFLFDLYRLYNDNLNLNSFWKIFKYYLPSGLFGVLFLSFHYKHTGWIGYHEASSWAPLFERVSFKGFLKNIGLLGWRLLDFGRIFLWFVLGFGFLKMYKEKIQVNAKAKELMVLMFATFIVLTPSMLLHKGLMAHRYLLPVALSINFLTLAILFKTKLPKKFFNIVYIVIFIGLFTGNFWVYPKRIAQGWDSTLGHLPYYKLRSEMIQYLDGTEVSIVSVGTGFPMIGEMEYLDLNDRKEGFHEKEIEKDLYILYSNISNDFSDEELLKLETDFEIVEEKNRGQVCMILYKRKD